jgi:hypothetical protein
MKAICAGTTTRGDVIHESLDMYRDVYIRTRRSVNILKAASENHDDIVDGWTADSFDDTVGRQVCARCKRVNDVHEEGTYGVGWLGRREGAYADKLLMSRTTRLDSVGHKSNNKTSNYYDSLAEYGVLTKPQVSTSTHYLNHLMRDTTSRRDDNVQDWRDRRQIFTKT